MDSCPACTASLRRNGRLHCTSRYCTWLICTTCHVTIDADTEAYWDEPHLIWGNPDGYLKAG
jgi:ferredoxin-like protein FixX